MKPDQGFRRFGGLAAEIGPFLAGTAVVYPAAVAAAALLIPAGTKGGDASASARLLISSWQAAFILAVILVPFFMNRSRHNNLAVGNILRGALRAAFLIAVSAVISLFLAPSNDLNSILNIVNFHIFLSAFAFLVASVFFLAEGVGAGGSASQFASTLAGFAMIGTVFYWNPLVESDVVTGPFREAAAKLCIGANPAVVAMHSFMGVDFFHIDEVYSFSALAGYHYQYPSWQGTAGVYALAGGGLVMCSVLAHMLRVALPHDLLRRDINRNREMRLLKVSEWHGGAGDDFRDAKPVLLDEAPVAEEPAPQGQSILESLFGTGDEKMSAPAGPASDTVQDTAEDEDAEIGKKALAIEDENGAGESWEEKAAALGLAPAQPKAPDTAPAADDPGEQAGLFEHEAALDQVRQEPAAPPGEPAPAATWEAAPPPGEDLAGLFDRQPAAEEPDTAAPAASEEDLASALAEFGLDPHARPVAAGGEGPPIAERPADAESSKEIKTGLIGNLMKGLGDLDTGRRTGDPADQGGVKTGLLGSLLRDMESDEDEAPGSPIPPGEDTAAPEQKPSGKEDRGKA